MNTLNVKTQIGTLDRAHQILEAFRLNWKTFLGIHIAAYLVSLLVLTPLLTVILGWLVLASGQTALTDEDILFFALTPPGLIIMLLAVSLYATVVIFQQAAMISAGHYASLNQNISLFELGRFLLQKFWPLFRLAMHIIIRTIVVAAPFLVFSALIYHFFLTEFDINYYLAEKPPVFWWAGAGVLLCLLIMTGVLLRFFSGWVLALPILIINNENPARALNKSRKASNTMRFPIATGLLLLLLLNTGVLAILSVASDFGVNGVVAFADSSLQLLAYLLGGLLVCWLLANVAITFFSNSFLSLFILSLFSQLIATTDDTNLHGRAMKTQQGSGRMISGARLAGLFLIVSIAAGLVINLTMSQLKTEGNTMIIAHRGASADAPENTLAAMELAITDGADWVEIDVQETREGEVVVIHDRDLKKIGGSALKVFDTPLAELQSVDIGSWKDPSFRDERVPSLQQLLALCKDRIKVMIELKYYGQEAQLEASVARIVEAADMQDQIVLMTLSYPGVRKMKAIRPGWQVGLLSSVAVGDITRMNVDFFAVNATFASRSFIKQARRRNRKVLVWTINDPISMSAMMSKGVYGIITDKPGLASKIRQERSELEPHERMIIQLASLLGKQPSRPEQ